MDEKKVKNKIYGKYNLIIEIFSNKKLLGD